MMIRNKGFSLLEILLAIVIFVVGMLALAHLQTNLTRSATDANTRTVAAGIAEEIIEELRGFRRISTDPNGTVFAFADIDDASVADTVPRGGINYVVTADVKGYEFNSDLTAVTETDPAVAGVVYDFKTIELTVTWNNNQEFLIDEGTTISNTDMDSGFIVLKDVIHSTPALADAVIAAEQEPVGGPIVDYTPGLNPDIVAIQLSNDAKFKESTKPKPDVIRRDELVETWFDVITYNTVTGDEGDESYFLRREEFLVVSCECTLRAADTDNPGFKPTTWNGKEYVEGDRVAKPYGESANNQQSPYCDTCCRDHHDDPSSASTDELYDPHGTWTSSSLGSNHGHYGRDNRGNLDSTAVSTGRDYVESCRMVRKDGFMRVAQDFRQEQFIALPQSYLADTAGVSAYSSYVTDAIDNFIDDLLNGDSTPDLDGPGDLSPSVTFPADATNNRMDLPVLLPASNNAQLVTRGVYVDHVTAEALALLDCLAPTNLGGQGNSAEDCDAEGITSYLEIFPFFDVQTTWLSLWEDNVNGNPIAVTNEQLADDNSHSRGLASITSASQGDVTITSKMHRGNIGLAATDPIDPYHFTNGIADIDLFLQANGGGSPPVLTGTTFSGLIGAVSGVQASGTTFTGGGGVVCQQNLTQFDCIIPDDATSPTLTISGYWKNNNTDLWICESTNLLVGTNPVQTNPKSTVFDLGSVTENWEDVQFTITTSATCP